MSRRTVATVVVACLLLALGLLVALVPVPYVTMSPGPTVDNADLDKMLGAITAAVGDKEGWPPHPGHPHPTHRQPWPHRRCGQHPRPP